MLLKLKPVRFLVTRVARAYGFLDPLALLGRLRGFSQISEVGEPIELLRAGVLFHARGLVNTKAIQNNLDWVWPYWVERQFNPADTSFIPRAFSFSHINLTHRNWTAVGLPDVAFYPIVDPRGLVTPIFDGWSIDCWLLLPDGTTLFPSKLDEFSQGLLTGDNLRVHSRGEWRQPAAGLTTEVSLCLSDGEPHCCVSVQAEAPTGSALVVALRPYNPEGISFIEKIAAAPGGRGWRINSQHEVLFSHLPEKNLFSQYSEGDISLRLGEPIQGEAIECAAGLATAAAIFPLSSLRGAPLELRAPIYDELSLKKRPRFESSSSWPAAMAPLARLQVSDPLIQQLFDQALQNVVLHTPHEVYPGPYTYKRFWFRDAVFVLNALLTVGGVERTRRALKEFVPRQRHDGYFLSQEGEWDSNGEALWFFHRFATLTGETLPSDYLDAIAKGARWIKRKRLPKDSGKKQAGLLPAGFSAEHLGPNDFYYWDDFWGIAGLQCAADLLRETDPKAAEDAIHEAKDFRDTVVKSFPAGPHRRFPGAIPASPLRRMDAGAIGSIVADYPLQLFPAGDPAILKTADYLCEHSSFDGAFFQDMIHSGINAYLTLHLAQVRLRAGQPAATWELMDKIASYASPTGQWPEAIHPRTRGGCMGDGQHIWAAAEWLLLVRNLFVREEPDHLVIGAGIKPGWLRAGPASFGPTLTPFGPVTVNFAPQAAGIAIRLEGKWRGAPPLRRIRLPHGAPLDIVAGDDRSEFFVPAA